MTDQGPIFLAGADRSGIGLLGELLELHPNISITRRTNFWSFYFNRFGDLGRAKNLERCLAEMMRNSRIRALRPQPERLRREFQEGKPTYARLFALLEEHHMQRLGRSRWGDKSLNSEEYADLILTAYPTAKMIHIIRDPRDRYASQLSHRGVGRGKLGAGVALWLSSARLAERNARKFKDRYKVIQYETLAREPEACLRDLCNFLGEEYSPIMLPLQETDRRTLGSSDTANLSPGPIRTTSIGRFRGILSERDVAFIQMCTHGRMVRYAYRPESLHLSWASALRYYVVDCPINLSNMWLWQPWAMIKEVIGRKPSARRLVHAT